ncbi:MAG: hypothetical protein IPG42_10665 [Betaproteobacteria bacterium]|nr:hypothetical protein [Betaproteobacteria bacterium]
MNAQGDLDKVAIGALLHMLQDSFSQAHAGRHPGSGASCETIPRFAQPGKISQFYSYAGQVGSLHDHEDTFNALGLQTLQVSPSVVDASRAFLTLWKENAPWSEAEKYFDCIRAALPTFKPALGLSPTETTLRLVERAKIHSAAICSPRMDIVPRRCN